MIFLFPSVEVRNQILLANKAYFTAGKHREKNRQSDRNVKIR